MSEAGPKVWNERIRLEMENERLRATVAEQAREIERLKQELAVADAFERSVNEALNSGDGSYKP